MIPFAVQPDSVRRPIGFRPPSNRIPFAVRSDCVRVTMTFREAFTAKIRKRKWNNYCFYCPKIVARESKMSYFPSKPYVFFVDLDGK